MNSSSLSPSTRHWILLLLGAGFLPAMTSRATDVSFYVINKRASYAQTGTGSPVLDGTTPYRFEADVIASGTGLVTSASIQIGGTQQSLSSQAGSTDFQFKQNFSSTTTLNTAYPAGNYVYTISTVHDGTKTPTLAMTIDNYPAGPHVSNFTAAQAVNAAASFTVTWDAFAGGTTGDLVEFEVDDPTTGQAVFSTPLPGSPGALDGTATSVVIPANTLTANHNYQGKVTFNKVTSYDTNSYPGAQGVALFAAKTSFNLATAGSVVSGTDVTQLHVAKGQSYLQTSSSTPALNGSTPYLFDAGANLSTSNVATGSVLLPNGTLKTFSVQPDELKLKEAYSSQTSLDGADPDGTYTVTLNTVDNGTKTITLTLSGSTYPSTPHISNFTAAQAIDASASFTLTWDAFSGGTTTDFISAEIDDAMGNTLIRSGDIGTAGALNGTATSLVIPGNTLQAGQTYQAKLLFIKGTAMDTNSYPGAIAVAGYFKETVFTIATAGGAVGGPDVHFYTVGKGQQFFQNNTNPPAPRSDAPFVFNAFVQANATGDVANASVQIPNGSSSALTAQNNGESFQFINGFSSQGALDTAYPNGTYTLSLNTVHDGLVKPALPVSGDTYPSVPHIGNFAAAQSVDATSAFTLTWDAMIGGSTNDLIQLTIFDSMGNIAFATPAPTRPGALNGTAASVVIPSNTLSVGQTYFGELLFIRGVADTASYPGATGLSGYYTLTDFNLTTRGATPALLINPARLSDGTFHVQLTGQASFLYEIDASTDLVAWSALTNITTGTDGTAAFVDPQTSGASHRFYRAAAGSNRSAMFHLSFNEYATAGTFGVNATPQSVFPVSLNSYRAILGVNNDSILPPATNVTFTGPAGSGLAGTPADFQNVDGAGSATYGSPAVSNPAAAPGGAWTVNYQGSLQTFTLPDPQANARLVIPVPTVTVVNGTLQQLTWIYKSAGGSTFTGPPSFMSNIQIQINGQGGTRLYDSPTQSPTTSNYTFPTNPILTWSNVTSIAMAYEDDLSNNYVVFFNH